MQPVLSEREIYIMKGVNETEEMQKALAQLYEFGFVSFDRNL